MWRLVVAQRATLGEIETRYSIDDLAAANLALDAWEAAEAEARRPKKGK